MDKSCVSRVSDKVTERLLPSKTGACTHHEWRHKGNNGHLAQRPDSCEALTEGNDYEPDTLPFQLNLGAVVASFCLWQAMRTKGGIDRFWPN